MKLLFLIGLICVANAKDWAVIVAGSKSYSNYRHQSDACHAFQICKKWGIPESRIITFLYDDVADSSKNPFRGKIFNKPASGAGVDVYAGMKKDYTGSKCTGDNFIKVLTGDKSAGGPVLESTADDRVFVNFADHGGTNLIAFPAGGSLSASKLNSGLKTMHDKKMYSKLVFYLEACESGSMFENKLPKDINIYATTAANARESSYGTYCPPNDKVNGKSIGSCLGDLYSVNWMENCDSVGKDQTLQQHYEYIKRKTSASHVMQYGSMSFTGDKIDMYIGDNTSFVPKLTEPSMTSQNVDVDSRDIPLHLAYYEYVRADKKDLATRAELRKAFRAEIDHREMADEMFYNLAKEFDEDKFFAAANPTAGECLCCDKVHEYVEQSCGGYSDYSLQYVRVIVNLCEVAESSAIIAKLEEYC